MFNNGYAFIANNTLSLIHSETHIGAKTISSINWYCQMEWHKWQTRNYCIECVLLKYAILELMFIIFPKTW